MIITQTPFRMSFFGGGTDMENFFKEHGGAVLSTTFDKYCYVNVRHLPRFFDYSTELSYSKTERVTDINDIQHPAIRNAMKMLDIKNVGFQKGEALEKLIREARFSIYPSEWYENCPFSVMESQMYGTPVLGANIGGIPELIQVGKTGELFESGNAEDLKKKIEKLWGDKKLCEQYSKNCKDISFDTIDEYYEKIMKVYR